jgi:predicted transcriptional regulator
MATKDKPISIAEAISPVPLEQTGDVEAWHLRTLKERHKAADAGRFALPEAVRAVIRKFVPNG